MSSLSPEGRKLLEASRSAGGPTSAQRVAMKQAVLAAVLLPGTAAAGTAAAGAKATGLALAAKLGIAVVSIGVAAALVWKVASPASPQAAAPAVEQRAAAVASPIERAPTLPPPVAEDAPAKVIAEAAPLVPRATAPRAPVGPVAIPSAVGPPPPPSEEIPAAPRGTIDEATLSREIAALSGAMSAVDSKSFTVALEQLSTYRAAFPSGVLEAEASVLEVLALCGLGRVEEARVAAASLPVHNPAVRRLERSCIAAGRK